MTLSSKCVRTVLFCLLFVGKINAVLAQGVDVKWGKEFMVEPRSDNGIMLGEDQEYYYLLTSVIKTDDFLNEVRVYSLESYSMEHDRVKSTKLELRTQPKKQGNFEAMYMLKGRFVLFFSEFDSKADLNILYSVNIDKEGKQDKPVMIDKASAKSAKKRARYNFVLSEDKARILVIRNGSYDKKSTEKFKYIMLADDMKTLWEKEVELPYMDKQFAINKYVIDETGNVFMLGTYKEDTSEINQYKVFAYDHEKSQLTELKLSLGASIVTYNLNFFYTNTGLYIVGLYSKASDAGKSITGLFYNRMNAKSYQIEVERVEEFDKGALSKFKTIGDTKKSKVFDSHYYKGNAFDGYYHIRDIIPRADGKIHLIAEDYRVSAGPGIDPTRSGGTGIDFLYNNNDVIVIQLSGEGKVDWATRIPKKQESLNDLGKFNSYLLAYDNENMYFLYNDNPKNAESFNNKEEIRFEDVKTANLDNLDKATIVLATVNSKGELTRELFGKTKENGVAFITQNYAHMTKDRIWIIGSTGRQRKFGFLTLKGNG